MTDILGPGSVATVNAVTTRKTDGRSFLTADTWFKPCTNAAAADGTQLASDFFNGLLAQLRTAIRGNGKMLDGVTPVIAENNANDAMLLGAIQALIQRGLTTFAVDTGTADALVVAPSPAVTEYKAGARFVVLKNPLVGGNATTTPTIAMSGLAPVTIVKDDASALAAGDLKKAVAFEILLDGTFARLVSLLTISDVLALIIASANYITGGDTGTAGAIKVATPIPAVTAPTRWMTVVTTPAAVNAGATTLTIGGVTGNVVYPTGSPLLGGEMQPRPQVFIYDVAGNWEWQGQQSPVLQQATSFYVNSSNAPVTSNGITYAAGSDTNSGTSPASPWASLAKAAAVVSALNANGQAVTCNVADGTYAPFAVTKAVNGSLTFLGDPANPSNCAISSGGVACVGGNFGAVFTLNGFKVTNAGTLTSSHGLVSQNGAVVTFLNIDFGSLATSSASHVYADGGEFIVGGNYKISGNAGNHVTSLSGGNVRLTPAFANTVAIAAGVGVVNFIAAYDLGYVRANTNTTYSGSVNGARFSVTNNAVVNTSGAGANFFPGNTAGTYATGGLYV